MAKRSYSLDTRVLTVFFFVAMPFVAFGSFVVVSMARGLLQDSVGATLGQQAVETKLLLERYIADQVTHLHLLCLDPQIRQAVTTPGIARSADDARKLEQAWVSGAEPKLTAILLQSPLAGRLRDAVQAGVGPKLIQVIDVQGRLVATSGRGGRLLNAETSWFKFLAGREYLEPQPYVGDIYRPATGSMAVLEIAYPIISADGRFMGAVRSIIDVTDLFSVMAPIRVGGSAESYVYADAPRVFMVRGEDGLILAGEDPQQILTARYAGVASLRAAIQAQRVHWIVPEIQEGSKEGERFPVARPARLAACSIVEKVPNVDWTVVVERDLAQATAPIKAVTRYLWIHFIGAFGTVILLALYFSFKLEAPVIEEELHLHEEHVPAGGRPVEG